MKIVLIGLGKIGKAILDDCASEGHDITIIDENKETVEKLIEKYDVLGVVGNGACMAVQKEAAVSISDMVIAVTGSDELNILACLVAKNLGIPNTIARVRNPQYRAQIVEMKEQLGISMILNPEKETANELFNLINLPAVAQIDRFAKGRATLVAIVVEKGCVLIGETLISISKKISSKVLICAVQRGESVFIPSGNFVIEEGDKIHFTSDANSLGDFLREIDLVEAPIKNVMIVGAGRIGYYLAHSLSKKKYNVKLIENDKQVAETMAEELPKINVTYGDGTNHEVLLEEGISAMDAFIILTGIDEENIIASMYANKQGVRRIITKIDREELLYIMDEIGIHNNVSPTAIIAAKVLRYVRAVSNKRGSNIVSLHRLVNNQVEALEFVTKNQDKIYNIPLKELKIKENCLIACIIRKDEVIIPDGSTCLNQNDCVVVITTHKSFDDLTDVFE